MYLNHFFEPNLPKTVWKPLALLKMVSFPVYCREDWSGFTNSIPWGALNFIVDSNPVCLFILWVVFLLVFNFCFFIWYFNFPLPWLIIPRPIPSPISYSASSPNFNRFCCFFISDISNSYFSFLFLLPPLLFFGYRSGTGKGLSILCNPPYYWIFSNRSYNYSLNLAPSPLELFSKSARAHLAVLVANILTSCIW